MAARVLYRDAQGRTGEVTLSPDEPCYIGRALDCAVRTDDAMVSRKHSLIRMEAGRFLVEDLGSSNGTHVNDIKVSRQTLNHNDVVRCGNLWLRYIDEGPSDSVPAERDASQSSKYRSTLGGRTTPDSARPKSVTEPPPPPRPPTPSAAPPSPPPSPPPPQAQPQPVAPPVPVAAKAGGGSPAATMMHSGAEPPVTAPPVKRPESPAATPAAVIRPDVAGRPLPRRPQSPHAQPISSDKPTGPELYETDPIGSTPREELERRLVIADERARELERGLLTLQAELQAAQEKIRALLRGVQELTGLKP